MGKKMEEDKWTDGKVRALLSKYATVGIQRNFDLSKLKLSYWQCKSKQKKSPWQYEVLREYLELFGLKMPTYRVDVCNSSRVTTWNRKTVVSCQSTSHITLSCNRYRAAYSQTQPGALSDQCRCVWRTLLLNTWDVVAMSTKFCVNGSSVFSRPLPDFCTQSSTCQCFSG